MKVVLTGGGTGGHFYPLIAVAERVISNATKYKSIEPKLYYFGEKAYNQSLLDSLNIKYYSVPSGKNRVYFSLLNIKDYFKIIIGVFVAFFKLLYVYPDIIFSKGGYDSLPTCLAAFLLRIPIIIHDSDTIPGRATLLVSRFASRIALSYPEASEYFKSKDLIAITGQPLLSRYTPPEDYIKQYNTDRKNILVTGGSLGSSIINETVLQILPELVSKYNVVHQTGDANIEDIKTRSKVILEAYNSSSYTPYATLDFTRIYPSIDLVISRAGSSVFEFQAWQIPSIIIPISESVSRDQVKNAQSIARLGGSKTLFEENLTPHVLLSAINSILEDSTVYNDMSEKSRANYKRGAANQIAEEIWTMTLSHN